MTTPGISRLAAYIIATNPDARVSFGGPCTSDDEFKGKYVGWITLGEEQRFRPLLNSEPIYDTKEDAIAAMQKVMDECKEIVENETDGEDPATHIMKEAGMDDATIDAVNTTREMAKNMAAFGDSNEKEA